MVGKSDGDQRKSNVVDVDIDGIVLNGITDDSSIGGGNSDGDGDGLEIGRRK